MSPCSGKTRGLRGQVRRYEREGKILDEMKPLIQLAQYESWGGYDNGFQLNIEGMVRILQANRRGN